MSDVLKIPPDDLELLLLKELTLKPSGFNQAISKPLSTWSVVSDVCLCAVML